MVLFEGLGRPLEKEFCDSIVRFTYCTLPEGCILIWKFEDKSFTNSEVAVKSKNIHPSKLLCIRYNGVDFCKTKQLSW